MKKRLLPLFCFSNLAAMTTAKKNSTHQLVLAALLVALTAIGAWTRVPFAPVPMTLQTLFVYLAGSILEIRYAFLSQVAYVFLGLAGVPVFANGGGFGYISQPTFGYLFALPVAAAVIAYLDKSTKANSWFGKIPVIGFGAICVFVLGGSWLYFYANHILEKSFSVKQALWSGVIPFLPGEIVKTALAAFISFHFKKSLEERSQ
jgi:biotin transport system substrate-specific component